MTYTEVIDIIRQTIAEKDTCEKTFRESGNEKLAYGYIHEIIALEQLILKLEDRQ